MCDLGLTLAGTWLEDSVGTLHGELETRGLRLKPHCWLAEEWFSPEGVPGIALPFYLAHKRLMRLEKKQMLEVEGGSRRECMRLLRHEAGHAMQHAFNLQRKRRWQELFGKASQPYPDFYRPNPASRKYVLHLDLWYAQSHPEEDFAETFAVWLTPTSRWRTRYKGWPALKKLEYVDELMSEIAGTAPQVRVKEQPYRISTVSKTLREHYAEKRERFVSTAQSIYDRDLRSLFSADVDEGEPAGKFLRRNKAQVRAIVARWSGQYEFTLEVVVKEMIDRCRDLNLRATGPEEELRMQFAVLLAARTTHQLYRQRDWYPM